MLIAEMLLLVAVNDKGHVSPWSGVKFAPDWLPKWTLCGRETQNRSATIAADLLLPGGAEGI